MIDRMVCVMFAASLLSAGACAKIPWIGPMLCTPAAEKIEEEAIDEGGDVAGDILMGHPVDVEVDLDSESNPICMHCKLHCPQTVTPAPVTPTPTTGAKQ